MNTPLPLRPFGRTGLRTSPIGLGCVTFGREIDAASASAVFERAMERGINLLDTAESYGDGASERTLGQLLCGSGLRDQLIVCSKVRGGLTRKRVRESAEESLRRLKIDVLDLFLLHRFDDEHPLEDALEALDLLVREGKVRFIGCSNFSAGQLEAAEAIQSTRKLTAFSVVQPMYSLVARMIERDVLPLCHRRGMGVLTYSPLAAGFLTGKYRANQPMPSGTRFDIKPGHRNQYFFPRSFALVEELQELEAETEIPAPRLALAWVFSRPHVSSVLVGARNAAHVDPAWQA